MIRNLTLGHLPSFRVLHAQFCGFTIFPDLSTAVALEEVNLLSNNINEIPKSAIAGLNKLRKLNIVQNRISHLPDLSHLVSLEDLNLNHNFLKSLPDLYELPLTDLRWAGNPLVCNETLCWVRMWGFTKPALKMGDDPEDVCEAPWHRKGLHLMDIHPIDMECYEGNLTHWDRDKKAATSTDDIFKYYFANEMF